MIDMNLQDFSNTLKEHQGYLGFWRDGETLSASDPSYQGLADTIGAMTDFKRHQAIFLWRGPESHHLHTVFLHRTNRGPGAGGVRRKHYSKLEGLLSDGLRLSLGMGYKNSLAGIWWGGGKGVIGITADNADEQTIYREFGTFLSALNGCYVTAEDVGTKPEDMASVFSTTRFTTCIPAEFGGSGNPSPATAQGVFVGIEAVLKHLMKSDWKQRTIGIQGLGEVGFRLANLLSETGASLVVYDTDPQKIAAVLALDERHRASNFENILFEEVDVLAPCALGAILNHHTIPSLRCSAVCGAANNQLELELRDAQLLHDRGIVYIPDFLVNRMGIVQCADEQYGRLHPDPAIQRHLGWTWGHAIGPLILEFLSDSHKRGRPPLIEALSRAEHLMKADHPIWPGRAKEIARQSWESMRDGTFLPGQG